VDEAAYHLDLSSDTTLERADKIRAVQYMSKPRTALLKEGEDESMVHKNISASLSSSPYKDLIISSATLPNTLIFKGDNLLKKIEEKRKVKQYIYVGRMQVEITQESPS